MNDVAPRVSVVIPTLNRLSLLREAVASVEAQTWRDYEIIVVDDGSSDGTAEWLRSQTGVRRVIQERGGVARARNAGIHVARGELIAFLDSDDLWEPKKLERQIAHLDAHPQCGLLATEVTAFDERGLLPAKSKARLYSIANGMVARQLLFGNWIATSSALVRRSCLDKVGVFDEEMGNFGEDWQLWVRIAAEFPLHFLAEPLVRYRVHTECLTSELPEEQFESLMCALDKLAALPLFQAEPHLIDEARYRICLTRAWRNAHADQRALATEKMWWAWHLRPFAIETWTAALRVELSARAAKRRMEAER